MPSVPVRDDNWHKKISLSGRLAQEHPSSQQYLRAGWRTGDFLLMCASILSVILEGIINETFIVFQSN